jgi:hypothetical protein
MKLRYLLPFLFFLYPQKSEAQFKAEGNPNSLDIKSEYVDISARNPFGLTNLYNLRGDINIKAAENNLFYFARNGILNNSKGLNIDVPFFRGYFNNSNQGNRTENRETQTSPIGEIITETTILEEKTALEFSIALNYRNFFASYESATLSDSINGSTLISIGEDTDLVPFSSESYNKSIVYSIGFKNGFFKFIQNRQDGERFNNFLVNANYSLGGEGRDKINLNVYYDRNFSGFFNFNFFSDLNFNLTYDSNDDNFRANLSTSGYSRLYQRDFERGLENRLRTSPRIYDYDLETTRRYLRDMFFTEPFSYNFTIDKDEIIANLNLNNILFHYSRDSRAIGLKYKFVIGTYDFEQNEARAGIFFGRGNN